MHLFDCLFKNRKTHLFHTYETQRLVCFNTLRTIFFMLFYFAPRDGFQLYSFLLFLPHLNSIFAHSRLSSFLSYPHCGPFFSLCLSHSWLRSTPALIITDGAAFVSTTDSHTEKQWSSHIHALAHSHISPESFVSHRMMKSAWSMSRPHLLCLRMPPLPTTAHFFRGSCRGLFWAEENIQLCHCTHLLKGTQKHINFLST